MTTDFAPGTQSDPNPPAVAFAPGPVTPVAAAIRAPRWGYQTSIFQTRQPAFWLFAVLLAITGLLVLGREAEHARFAPLGWFLSWILVLAYAIPVFLLIYALDLFEREPLSLLVASVLWGGVVSIGFAGDTNGAFLEIIAKVAGPEVAREWGAAIVGPTVEETLKILGVIVIFLIARSEIDDLFDGFVYGAMVGLGFDLVENVGYFLNSIAQSPGAGQIGPVIQSFFLRVIATAPFSHVFFSGVAGLGFAYYVTQRDQPHAKRLQWAIGLFAAAWLAHFFVNSPLLNQALLDNPLPAIIKWPIFGFIKGLPFLIFVYMLVRLAHRREQRWFQVASATEVGSDVLTQEDLSTLSDLRTRRRARKALGLRKGKVGERLLGRLQREQLNLVMAATRYEQRDHPDLVRQRDLIRNIRNELQALPDVAAPAAFTQPPVGAQSATGMPAMTAGLGMPAPPPPWAPTHRVPGEGMQAWDAPDPARPAMVMLAGGLDLAVVQGAGDWAQVVAVNGWTGWVDGRRLIPLGQVAPPRPG